MNAITLTFAHVRETKNAHLFTELDAKGKVLDIKDAICGAIYLKKSHIGDKAPAKMRITIEVEAAKSVSTSKKSTPAKNATATVDKGQKLTAKAEKPVTVKKSAAKQTKAA